ncbi:flocculation protein FLO11-like [Dendronephthya gigantea]|uniref:flocculation protein FLO11-like n=1 Tax=Dendronephthya gigantea TaxID=151771 RepID=UPI0010691451|nr:flocculation protein FLO11-like [Dendronephthya gigantea]
MVVKFGDQNVGNGCKGIRETATERDNANSTASSIFASDTQTALGRRRPAFGNFSHNIESTLVGKREYEYRTPELNDGIQTNHIVPVYTNMSVNEGIVVTEADRTGIVVRRRPLLDSIDRQNSPRNSTKYENEYECMSSPDTFSNSSSNRSSSASSHYGNISPDTLSLASFAGRLNFGRFSVGSKRSSQSSSASSQDSGRQSWGKIRDSFDLSDALVPSIRRTSGEHAYENTKSLAPDNSMRVLKFETHQMEVTDHEEPPPLPTRQSQQQIPTPSKEEPEMILPYKVVDLDELQRSLEDIEPYYVHNGSEDAHRDFYNDIPDPNDKDVELDDKTEETSDFRPKLPPKARRKNLTHSQSDPACFSSATALELPVKDKPIPRPRQSVILSDLAQLQQDGTVQNSKANESADLPERSMSTATGHISRRQSPPSGSKTRRSSTSPHKNPRPMRSAPRPPPPRSSSPAQRVSSTRPVSEMFPRGNTDPSSPMELKRSMTVSLLQSPFNRRPVESLCEEKTGSENSVENSTTFSSIEPNDEKSKEDTAKASKTSAFFKKALSTLKIPGTKKTTKKELAISPPSDFTSLYQTRLTTDYSNREQKTISYFATDDIAGESAVEVVEPDNVECEPTTKDPEEPMEQLSFHPEFTGLPLVDTDHPGDRLYYNFPISPSLVDTTEKLPVPRKPPRSGYVQPSLSQLTKEREEEISLNKIPELGPLPTPPDGSGSSSASPIQTPECEARTLKITAKDRSGEVTPEDHIYSVTTPDSDDQKESIGKVLGKPKPEVPRRPSTLKLKPKIPNRPVLQSIEKPTPIPRSSTLDIATIRKSRKESLRRNKERRHSTPLEESSGLSRSCDSLDDDFLRDNNITDMHLIVLKDILRCWQNMLRKPTISLAGACWEDFEAIESESWPKVSEDQDSVSLPVRLREESTILDSNNCCGQYIAKIKCKSQVNGNTKSPFDQDYSVCTSVQSHENVSRVLAYFRGEIRSSILGMENDTSPLHTTISISDHVPSQTCVEFVAQSKDAHSKDPLGYEKTVCMLMLQCLKGVAHLHNSGFTHGNLNLRNLFLIKHTNDFQLLLGNFGRSQSLSKERRGSHVYTKIDDSPTELSGDTNDFIAISELFTAMLHQDHNGNGTHASEVRHSTLSRYLRTASERLRDGSALPDQVVCLLQALLWGPFKPEENIVIISESRMKHWLDRQRSEFIARLAMDEALARTVGGHSRKFSMEDLLLCEYLTVATPSSLVRTEKCWFLAT